VVEQVAMAVDVDLRDHQPQSLEDFISLLAKLLL
jgi:hypothetical protein